MHDNDNYEILRVEISKLKELVEYSIIANLPTKNNNIKFNEYINEWYRLDKKHVVSLNTCLMYDNLLNIHILPYFKGKNLGEITSKDVQGFLNYKAKFSSSMVKKLKSTLNQVFNRAIKEGVLDKNPVALVKLPKTKQAKEREPIRFEHIKEVTDALIKHPKGAFPLLLMYTGLRRGEACALLSSDIFDKWLKVNKAVTFPVNKPVLGETKTKSSKRVIPVPDFVLQKLDLSKKYVFGGTKMLTESAVCRMFEILQRDIPHFKNITPHILRHTYTMLLRRANVDPATAQYFLGHSDFKTTAQIYTHIDFQDVQEGNANFNNLINRLI